MTAAKTIRYSRIVDLSHPISPDMPGWPGDPPTCFETVADYGRDGYFLRRFAVGEHSGTHINAPIGFHPQGDSVDALAAESLVLPAVVIDVADQARVKPDFALDQDTLSRWEVVHGLIPPGSLVMLNSGWGEKWASPRDFLNVDERGIARFPGFSLEAARFLVGQRNAAGIGIDTHGVDPAGDLDFRVNRYVLGASRIVLENLANLHQLPPTGATVVIGALKLLGGSGSPAAVTAFVP